MFKAELELRHEQYYDTARIISELVLFLHPTADEEDVYDFILYLLEDGNGVITAEDMAGVALYARSGKSQWQSFMNH